MRTPKLAQALLDLGRISENPAVDRAVVDLETALSEQALDVAAAQGIAQIPGDCLDNESDGVIGV
ncbi:hypothetical protein MJC1_03930 [Methylocystis sp. MJC1]|nr:hypothetical protein MJC1_03930 [Methylocystis sp. MJC1]